MKIIFSLMSLLIVGSIAFFTMSMLKENSLKGIEYHQSLLEQAEKAQGTLTESLSYSDYFNDGIREDMGSFTGCPYDVSIAVNQARLINNPKDPESKYLQVYIMAKNGSSKTIQLTPNCFSAADLGGTIYPVDPSSTSISGYFNNSTLPANSTTGSWLTFKVPERKNYKILYRLNKQTNQAKALKDIVID